VRRLCRCLDRRGDGVRRLGRGDEHLLGRDDRHERLVRDYSMTITGYSGGVLTGTFTGSLARSSGTGAATIQITNGKFRVALDVQ
jgi:hypothetical protein